jgi:hypothetical protein
VWLAPRPQLAELQTICKLFAGEGPTLMTEYQPYGVRHFLRQMDPEGASERRRRLILLRTGTGLQPGFSADLDAFELNAILVYRTLVLHRSPVESRPPSVYQLVRSGHWYEVWQRPQQPRQILEHLSLGQASDPAAVPPCADVLRLAQRATEARGLIAAVVRNEAPIVLDLALGSHSTGWKAASDQPGTLITDGRGSVSLDVDVSRLGRYDLWLAGSFRRTVTTIVDGHQLGSVRQQLNGSGQWTPLGATQLGRGTHHIVLQYGGSRLAPGSGGFPFAMGPLSLSTTTADVPITFVNPRDAHSLCGKRLDWVEALAR